MVARKHTDEELVSAVEKYGTQRKAAEALGINRRSLERRLARMKQRGAHPVENSDHVRVWDDFKVARRSQYYDAEGKPANKWIITTPDREAQAIAMEAAFNAMKEDIPREKPRPAPSIAKESDLLNCFVITDYHMGALSWRDETDADWDMDIAEDTLVEWFRKSIELSPNAETALLAQISDLLHWDGFDAVTPASKHLLDADTRFPKLVRVAIRVLRRIIGMLLDKHPKLHIVMADANHDPVSQVWLREWLSVMYEEEPRVTVDTSPSPYNAFEFGSVAIFMHHGHKRKVGNVSEVFAAKFREMFGRTKYAYAHMGHLHHVDIKENNLMVVEQHRTLAAPDAYAARGGYLSGRDAKVITYHKDYGEVSRTTVSFDMVKATGKNS